MIFSAETLIVSAIFIYIGSAGGKSQLRNTAQHQSE